MGDHLFKWFLALVFGPAVVLVGLYIVTAILAAVLPVLILLAVIAGVAAGVSAALVLRRRLLPWSRGNRLAAGTRLHGEPIRRPRGRGEREE